MTKLIRLIWFRMALQAVAMTGCDLSASTKPWKTQEEIVKVIFDEFYDQVNFP